MDFHYLGIIFAQRGEYDTLKKHELRGDPHLKHMLPAAAWYVMIICVRFFRAERGKPHTNGNEVPLCRRQKSRPRNSRKKGSILLPQAKEHFDTQTS